MTSENPEELKAKYEKLITNAENHLKEAEVFNEENIGKFWAIVETRPYMRSRHTYVKLLIEQGKFRKAIKECMPFNVEWAHETKRSS